MDFVALADKLGIPVAILFAVGLALWRIITFIGKQLFDDERGYVPKVVAAHTDMTNRLAAAGELHTAAVTEIKADIKDVKLEIIDIRGRLPGSSTKAA